MSGGDIIMLNKRMYYKQLVLELELFYSNKTVDVYLNC